MACSAGVEPAPYGLEGRCSIQLNYEQKKFEIFKERFGIPVDSQVAALNFSSTESILHVFETFVKKFSIAKQNPLVFARGFQFRLTF